MFLSLIVVEILHTICIVFNDVCIAFKHHADIFYWNIEDVPNIQTRPKLLLANSSAASPSVHCYRSPLPKHAACMAECVFNRTAIGRPDCCVSAECLIQLTGKWSSLIMCSSRLSLFMCVFSRKMSGCVWVFQPLSSFFVGGSPGPQTAAVSERPLRNKQMLNLNTTYGGVGGEHAFKKREDNVFWVISLQPEGVYILYICTKLVCLCVLCRVRGFFFLAWLPWIPDTKGDINKTQGFNHSAHKKASSHIVRSLSVGSLIVCRSTDIDATIGGQCRGVISLWQHFQSVDIFFLNFGFSLLTTSSTRQLIAVAPRIDKPNGHLMTWLSGCRGFWWSLSHHWVFIPGSKKWLIRAPDEEEKNAGIFFIKVKNEGKPSECFFDGLSKEQTWVILLQR